MPKIATILSIVTLLFLLQCAAPEPDLELYVQGVEAWQESRTVEMRDTSKSWLSLVGLHWLEAGESTFGADSSNTLQFPNTAPDFAGSFILEDTMLKILVAEGVQVLHEGQPIQELILRHDMNKPTTYLQMGSINIHAIKRPEGMAIRVKDSQNPALVSFEDIPNFPIDPDWKVEAQLEWYDEPQDIQIPTVLGSERTQKCPAKLVFQMEEKVYELFPYKSFYGDPVWTVIFGDLTNGETTYGGGRFLSLDAPEPGASSIKLDFNKAYNPPCAFSAFATCPLPPTENRMALAILAGEKSYGKGH